MKVPEEVFADQTGTIQSLRYWYEKNLPETIEMTLQQEGWYRMLFPDVPWQQERVSFRGHTINVI